MVRAVRPSRSLSMARGCARIDSRIDTVKISLAGRVEVHHARLLAVIGVRKTFPHGLDPSRTSEHLDLCRKIAYARVEGIRGIGNEAARFHRRGRRCNGLAARGASTATRED